MSPSSGESPGNTTVSAILDRVRSHSFHPVTENGRTIDRDLTEEGIADLDDPDWKIRLLAIRDLVKAESESLPAIVAGLADDDLHVRYVCTTALGVLRARTAINELERLVRADPNPITRSQAVIALGQIGAEKSLPLLRTRQPQDSSPDVSHQIGLAIDRIEKDRGVSERLAAAYREIDPATFGRLTPGDSSPSFMLPDTDYEPRRLETFQTNHDWVVLLWVFADWCPVCHSEFQELIEHQDDFASADIGVATIECHDMYRCRVMAGKELHPDYRFSEGSLQPTYADEIWWPHLVDRAGAVGATYGVDPMAFAVQAEYVNRPATIILDETGTVRFAYYGTFWGDRPAIGDILEMIRREKFDFTNPERLTA